MSMYPLYMNIAIVFAFTMQCNFYDIVLFSKPKDGFSTLYYEKSY